jgi:hypothetical protein
MQSIVVVVVVGRYVCMETEKLFIVAFASQPHWKPKFTPHFAQPLTYAVSYGGFSQPHWRRTRLSSVPLSPCHLIAEIGNSIACTTIHDLVQNGAFTYRTSHHSRPYPVNRREPNRTEPCKLPPSGSISLLFMLVLPKHVLKAY